MRALARATRWRHLPRAMTFFPPPRRARTGDPRALFAAEAEAALCEALPDAKIRFVPESFSLAIDLAGDVLTFFLENSFVETREMPPDARRARVVAATLSSVCARGAERWEDVAPRLVPVLRPTSTFVTLPAEPLKLHPLARRPFAPFLVACLAVDDPATIRYLRVDQLEAWGASLDDAFAIATANLALRDTQHGVEPYDRDAAYPIFHVAVRDSYESSRLLLPGWLSAFASRVRGRPIAIVPERGQLIVTGDGDPRALERLLVTAEREFFASQRSVSAAVYTVDDAGNVVPYVAPHGHPLRAATQEAHYKFGIDQYRRQKAALDESNAKTGENTFVATYIAVDGGSAGGEPFSFAAWSRVESALLPIVDRIALQHPQRQEPLWVPWRAAREIAGAYLRDEPGLDPPRVRVRGLLDADTLAKLERASRSS
jgi:hypothetical protein